MVAITTLMMVNLKPMVIEVAVVTKLVMAAVTKLTMGRHSSNGL